MTSSSNLLLRITSVTPLAGFRLRLTLTDGSVVERDVGRLIRGPVFDAVRADRWRFEAARIEAGTVAWPGGADLDPDVLIWGGAPPRDQALRPPAELSYDLRRA